jgi:hypothetical protein
MEEYFNITATKIKAGEIRVNGIPRKTLHQRRKVGIFRILPSVLQGVTDTDNEETYSQIRKVQFRFT